MKLKKFVENLNKLIAERPDVLELDVVTAKDDEGNGFYFVCHSPSVGHMDEDRDFTEEREVNAICIN